MHCRMLVRKMSRNDFSRKFVDHPSPSYHQDAHPRRGVTPDNQQASEGDCSTKARQLAFSPESDIALAKQNTNKLPSRAVAEPKLQKIDATANTRCFTHTHPTSSGVSNFPAENWLHHQVDDSCIEQAAVPTILNHAANCTHPSSVLNLRLEQITCKNARQAGRQTNRRTTCSTRACDCQKVRS